MAKSRRKAEAEIPKNETEGRKDSAEAAPMAEATIVSGKDQVFFFSRLTQTLEKACGADNLANRLAELRRMPPSTEELANDLPQIERTFKRLGIVENNGNFDSQIENFSDKIGRAVSRSGRHVLALLRIFAAGDDRLGLKPVCGAMPRCGYDCRLTRECDYFNNPRKPEIAAMTPVQRLITGNDKALSDAELLALCVIGEKGTGRETIVDTLLKRYGRLRAVFRADPREYAGIRGMTRAQVVRLACQSALYRRLLAERRDSMLHISSARDIYHRYAAELREYRVEAAVLLMLDQHNNVLRDAWFTGHSPNSARIGIADLLRPAVREYAVRVALIHNHPSDNAYPSEDDKTFTRTLYRACLIFGIGFVDHVIVTESGYFSFNESGLLMEMRVRSELVLNETTDIGEFWSQDAPDFLLD